mmetsp:Transcript_24059/g.49307  ORF Transcript_24059/g.49307 Transcript_24059/m.49307 type:complete len:95 (-) Transcript_24059:248-532(-)
MAIRSRFAAFGRGSAVAPLSVPDGGGGGACGYVNRSGGGAGGDAGGGDLAIGACAVALKVVERRVRVTPPWALGALMLLLRLLAEALVAAVVLE